MKRTLPLAALVAGAVLLPSPARAQHPSMDSTDVVTEGRDFRVYDGKGHSKSFAEVVAAMAKADAVLVGETHDDVVGHGVEDQIFMRGAQRVGAVGDQADGHRLAILSMEMFERDVQYIVDEYLQDLITEDQFLKSSRPWDRYNTDYRPMVEFAKAHDLPVVAANAPRRYVNRVSRLGPASLDALSALAKSYLPALPYPGPSKEYTAQWNALMADMMGGMQAPPSQPSHDMSNALQAQALWDAAMGGAVADALNAHPGALVVHYAGSFHVQKYTGIPERVRDYRPGTKILTVVMEPAEDIDGWTDDEHKGLGDFVILTKKPTTTADSGR